MKGDRLPDHDTIARLYGAIHRREDGRPGPTAFKPRPSEAYVSVNWLEYFSSVDRPAQIATIKQALASKRSIGTQAKLAILNVGAVRLAGANVGFDEIDVRHEPEAGTRPDPSHCGIFGFTDADEAVHEALALMLSDIVAARSNP